jgi:hypothetical protein
LTEENNLEDLDYDWLDSVLDEDLSSIVEDLEAGGKISVAEFSRLVELHREHYALEEMARQVEWHEGWGEKISGDS